MSPSQLAQSLAAGLICGFLFSIPVGPVNLAVINQALRKGFLAAFKLGLGAMAGETVYATLLLAGHSSLLDNDRFLRIMRVVALLIITALGVRYLLIKEEKIEAGSAVVQKVDERWHHPRTVLLGFIMTISNLMLLLLWATVATMLFANEWVAPSLASRSLCSAGVFLGGSIWFFLVSFFVSRAHRRVKPRTLLLLARASGLGLLLCAALLAAKIFRH